MKLRLISHALQKRFGIFRNEGNNLSLFDRPGEGTVNGEGAAYFVLSGEKSNGERVCIEAVKMLYKPKDAALKKEITSFLEAASLKNTDIDLVVLGKSGDGKLDSKTDEISSMYFADSSIGLFKHLSGEYPTASAFALWLAAKIIQENHIPDAVVSRNTNRPLKRVLIYNPYFGTHHSLILLRAC